jgi:hypothetical protein
MFILETLHTGVEWNLNWMPHRLATAKPGGLRPNRAHVSQRFERGRASKRAKFRESLQILEIPAASAITSLARLF